jgi:hypothetical protein
MPMAHVLSCNVNECAYNQNRECHASSIMVGADHPTCDTFTKSIPSNISKEAMPEVSKCSVENCRFNQNLICQAPGITVGHHMEHADCATFLPS